MEADILLETDDGKNCSWPAGTTSPRRTEVVAAVLLTLEGLSEASSRRNEAFPEATTGYRIEAQYSGSSAGESLGPYQAQLAETSQR